MVANIIIGVTSLALGFLVGVITAAIVTHKAIDFYKQETGNDIIVFLKEHTDEN